MKQARPIEQKDYSGLFVGAILTGLVIIVFVLMTAVGQSRARELPLRPAVVPAANVVLTPTIYFAPSGTN